MRRRHLLVLLGVAAPLALGTPALAYWSATGSGGGNATTGTLDAPANVTASATGGSRTVHLAWNASSLSTGQPATGYYATRIRTSDGTASAACGTAPTTPTAATTCSDLDVVDGSYHYVVAAAYRSWTAASAAGNTVLVDATAPTVTATQTPAPNANGYNQTSPVTVNLSATDNAGGAGVASITYALDGGAPLTTAGSTVAVVVSVQGTHTVAYYATDNAANVGTPGSQLVKIDTTKPNVTVNQAAGQTDPTTASTINFTAVFSEAVTGLPAANVTLSGTALATTATVTGSGTTYTIAVSGMTKDGTVVVAIAAGKAQDAAGNTNTAFTSTDNTVTYDDTTKPTVTVNQAADQADPSPGQPINFTAVFSEPVTGLVANDITRTGTALGGTTTLTGSGTTYNIAISDLTKTGTVTATIGANKAQDASNNTNTASTSTDNTVTYSDTTAPTVTITSLAKSTSQRVTVTGTGGNDPGDPDVTVVLCATNTFPCTGPNIRATLTPSVNASGVWTVTSGNIGNGTTVWARATQTDLSGNTGTSAVVGPVTTGP